MNLAKTWLVGMVAATLLGVLSAPAASVVLLNGTTLQGSSVRIKLDGTVVLRTADGATREFAKGQYKLAIADMPPEFTTAAQALAGKQYQGVIDTLEKVVGDLNGLEVDKQLRFAMARAYIGLGKPGEAVAQFDTLAKHYGADGLKDPKVAVEYASALLAAKQNDKLVGVIDEIVKNAPRNVAAKAQTMRGQMREQQGQLDAALMDYMRTVVFFDRETDAVPEALFRAAEVLEKKRDPRAKMLYKRLADEYKDSPFAQKASGKA